MGDIPGIRSLLDVTWRDTYSSFLSELSIAKLTARWHSAKVFETEINQQSTFFGVAENSLQEIVGMVTAHSREDLLFIARLYVLPGFQRQGIGGRLIEESYRTFAQVQRVQLNVEEQNLKARAFYRKLGFQEIGVKIDDVAGAILQSIVLEKQLENTA
jgi:ribosomal protein S18 acetylase RimI-like enzyme